MKIELAIDPAKVRALLNIAPEKEVRYYLVGVYLDIPANRMVATDGSCMGILALSDNAETMAEFKDCAPVIMPRTFCESIGKVKSSAFMLTVDYSTSPATLTATLPTGTVSAPAIDGRYPEYTRVIPQGPFVVGVCAAFDGDIVARVQKFLGGVGAWYHTGATDRAAVLCRHDALAVIMPMRNRDEGLAGIMQRQGLGSVKVVESLPDPCA